MPECVKELTHALFQSGPKVCIQAAKHPKHSRYLTNVFDYGTGWGICLDAAGEVAKPATEKHLITKRLSFLKTQQKKAPWQRHQSFANGNRGIFCWSQCPGKERDRGEESHKIPYDTFMLYEECSDVLGEDMYFCNGNKSGKSLNCHLAYHNKHHRNNS